jgi:hypothetical protein
MNPERWRQIEELYHAARELAPADRAALLAQTDQELRLEVEAMLAQDASGQDTGPARGGIPNGFEIVHGCGRPTARAVPNRA